MNQDRPGPSSGRSAYLRQLVRVEGMGRGLRRLLFAVGSALVIYALVLGDGGLLRLHSLRGENQRRADEIARLREDSARLEAALEELQTPASLALERVARERYGMLREGERVVHVLGSDSATPSDHAVP